MNPGDILENRYQIVERLGAGGMGEVYKALHLHLGATRVIKIIHPHISGNADASERFIREARTSTKVHHQNVATLHDFSTLPNGSHYMVWEYIEGENLAQRLRSKGTLAPKEAINLVVQALHGLEAIHRAGIVHRDISPENLMIAPDDTIKIIDLGVAKVEDAAATSQTRTGMFVGKLRYAAPEQLGFIPEGEKIDGRTDIYAMAMVLVELLTGRPPYEAKSPHEYFIMHASQAPLKTVELPSGLPGSAALQAVIERALARNRNDRFRTAREFAFALEDVGRTLSDSHDSATMMLPLDGDATVRPGTRPPFNDTTPDGLHRSTLVTGSASAPTMASPAPPPPPPAASATVLTPLPQQGYQAPVAGQPQAFRAAQPRQGSILPLLIVLGIVLFAGAAVAGLLLWPRFMKTPDTQIATNTGATIQPPSPSTQPAVPATSTLTVTTETGDATTATIPTATIVETQTAAPAPVTQTVAPAPVPVPVVPAPTPKPRPVPREAEPEPEPEPEPVAPRPVAVAAGTFVDGGDDEEGNDRALRRLRSEIKGTKRIALRAGGLTVDVMRAIREFQPDVEFDTNADVVVRFEGTNERRGRGLKRRAATASIEKNGRVIFRYQLPDETYRVGDSSAEAFARVLSTAIDAEED